MSTQGLRRSARHAATTGTADAPADAQPAPARPPPPPARKKSQATASAANVPTTTDKSTKKTPAARNQYVSALPHQQNTQPLDNTVVAQEAGHSGTAPNEKTLTRLFNNNAAVSAESRPSNALSKGKAKAIPAQESLYARQGHAPVDDLYATKPNLLQESVLAHKPQERVANPHATEPHLCSLSSWVRDNVQLPPAQTFPPRSILKSVSTVVNPSTRKTVTVVSPQRQPPSSPVQSPGNPFRCSADENNSDPLEFPDDDSDPLEFPDDDDDDNDEGESGTLRSVAGSPSPMHVDEEGFPVPHDADVPDPSDLDEEYIVSRARERRADVFHNSHVRPGHRVALDDDEIEEDDFAEFLSDTARRHRRPASTRMPTARVGHDEHTPHPPKCPQPQVASSLRSAPPQVASSSRSAQKAEDDTGLANDDLEDDDDDDEDEDEDEVGGLKRGPPSKRVVQEAIEIWGEMWGKLNALAKRKGTRVSTLAKASGLHTQLGRSFHARIHVPKAEGESTEDYRQAVQKSYHALFDVLPDEECNDPAARSRITQPYIDKFLEATQGASSKRKNKNGSTTLMAKTDLISKSHELEVMGICADLSGVTNNQLSWGGSDLYLTMKERHPEKLSKIAIQLVDLLRQTKGDLELEAAGSQQHPNPVAVTIGPIPPESARDATCRMVKDLALNSLHQFYVLSGSKIATDWLSERALMERDGLSVSEVNAQFKKMVWKTFFDVTVKHHICWKNWPNTLKAHCPGPGWNFASIKDLLPVNKDGEINEDGVRQTETSALRAMAESMSQVYQGNEDDSAPYIDVWDEDDVLLDNPTNVAIVTCLDGTVLARAGQSTKLLKSLRKVQSSKSDDTTSKKPSKKRVLAPASEGEDDVDDDDGRPRKHQYREKDHKKPTHNDSEEEPEQGGSGSHTGGSPKIVYWTSAKSAHFFSDKGQRRTYSTEWKAKGYVRIKEAQMTEEDRHTQVQMERGKWVALDGCHLLLSEFERSIAAGCRGDIVF
ncbi:hypothetical protein C8F01DRAFT_1092383 [Mycena amicta]|nr:hypothetical protein C8F01DRAFT_1092383 [Mycena amicta]